MRKKLFMAACTVVLCIAAATAATAEKGNTQEEFLADMAEGLNARWAGEADESAMSSSEIVEYRSSLVAEEYNCIGKYKEETFENQKFDLMAHAYIEAVEMQANAVKYFIELPEIYEAEWAAGYNLRAMLIPNFVDQYGLDVPEEEVAPFRNGSTVVVEEPQSETRDVSEENEATEIELFNQEGIRVVLTGMEEPTLDFTKFKVKIENLNHKDIVVTTDNYKMVINGNMTDSMLHVEVQSGKTADTTIDFYNPLLKEDGIEEIKELSFTIQILNAETFMPIYVGEEKFITVDDEYKLHEKAVYTDSENIQKVQELLNAAGYDCGSADGVPGKKTNSALLQFEKDHGLPETTDITPELIEALERVLE
jgi:hypothetical protein